MAHLLVLDIACSFCKSSFSAGSHLSLPLFRGSAYEHADRRPLAPFVYVVCIQLLRAGPAWISRGGCGPVSARVRSHRCPNDARLLSAEADRNHQNPSHLTAHSSQSPKRRPIDLHLSRSRFGGFPETATRKPYVRSETLLHRLGFSHGFGGTCSTKSIYGGELQDHGGLS